ncbi:MAG TPA: winged helix-turn-helix domain-containing protein, partial [Blastocatellia bacterium]|nr:winged helix-turn-helix domain-containing protein [Blastocatellia bacterium]
CAKLWQSITVDERSALNQLSGTSYSGYNTEVMRRLRLKGLIQEQAKGPVVFSPLLAAYARNQRIGPAPELRIQAGAIRIDSAGDVWIEGQRISPSLSAKELLFLEYLCLEPGRLRSKDEIIAVVYPNEYKSGEMISDDALNAVVKRLRARIEALSPHGYIVTLRGKGYRLDTGV